MNKHLFSGHAQLPEGSDVYEQNKYLSLIIMVDLDTGIILDCYIPTYCALHNNFVAEILKDKSLDNELTLIIKQIERTLHMQSKRALITALQTVFNRYCVEKKVNLNKPGK